MGRRESEDLADFLSDHRWPNFMLPVKRRVPGRYPPHETAVLFTPAADAQSPITFYEGNMFSGIDTTTAKTFVYPTPMDAIRDGWEVD